MSEETLSAMDEPVMLRDLPALLRELAELRDDKARLDWLEQGDAQIDYVDAYLAVPHDTTGPRHRGRAEPA